MKRGVLRVDEEGNKIEGPKIMKGQTKPAHGYTCESRDDIVLETLAFARRREKSRRRRELAKASRKKNR